MVCANHNFQFPIDLKIYTFKQLKIHKENGGNKKGGTDSGGGGNCDGFKGHPICKFCSHHPMFYSNDELMFHLRNSHEKCHICDRIDHNNPKFFKNYDQLFKHFKDSHYVCTVPSCLDMKFVVFKDNVELEAHLLKEHSDILPTHANQHQQNRFFQSELSTFITTPSRVIRETPDSIDYYRSNSGSSLNSLNNTTNAENSSPEIKRLRLDERAKLYLNNSPEEFEEFARLNENYTKNKLTTSQLIQCYKELFTSPQSNIYLLIHNLGELFPPHSTKYKELDDIYRKYEIKSSRDQLTPNLPSLYNNSTASVPMRRAVWGTGSNSSSSNNNNKRNPITIRSTNNLPTLGPPPLSSTIQRTTTPRASKIPSYKTTNTITQSSSPSLNNSDRLASLPQLPKPKPKRAYIPPVKEPSYLILDNGGNNNNKDRNRELLTAFLV
ncbi:uncharacterized protein NDAI_0F00810 [Naumovozyma dairenensis CBS 421]|uniref:C2H2-type domain-containing protein n=1 Tax=Naumovozyma dairenensis (strain ATCC 10597 / BCRC 20456 / CBS 421 / NBRC 0211 / NRRL Y-12639) TaxID=1071378 RepID=G0WC89_NAUDC|nr:hypothetical protein NDAI_0F00810 [Naumovozyma dairenensis CBS 421]CCD25400.1 hypothetical protein NDAI_0F00810 [Naumovozyma dairenensis CBS 421]